MKLNAHKYFRRSVVIEATLGVWLVVTIHCVLLQLYNDKIQ